MDSPTTTDDPVVPDVPDLPPSSRQRDLLTALADAARRVQEELTPGAVLAATGEQLRRLGLDWHYGLLAEDGRDVVIEATSLPPRITTAAERLLGFRIRGYRLPVDTIAPLRTAVRERRALYVPAEEGIHLALPRLPLPIVRQLARLLGARGIIVAPLMARGAVIGTLSVWANDLTPEDVPAIVVFAQQAAIAFENARLIQALQESEERFRTLADATFEGIVIHENGRHVLANRAFAEMLGFARPEDAVGVSSLDCVAPESHGTVLDHIRAGSEEPYEVVGLRRDGTRFDAEILGRGMRYQGRSVRVVAVRDVTARKRAEAALRFIAEASRVLAASLDYETTLQNVVRLAVPRLADWCALDLLAQPDDRTGNWTVTRAAVVHVDPSKEALVRELAERYPPPPTARYGLPAVLRTGQSQVRATMADDELIANAVDERHLEIVRALGIASFMAVPLVIGGQAAGALSFFRSTPGRPFGAEEVALAEELGTRVALAVDNARLFRQAREAIAARDEFLSVAAHELKTPVTSLRGFAQATVRQLSRTGQLEPARVEQALRVIDRQSEKLAKLVAQLLDISRIEAGKLSLEPRAIDVTRLVADAVASARQNAPEHSLTLAASIPIVATVDTVRLEQVIANLLDNAIKFSPAGGPIEVAVTLVDAGRVQISVRDHGLGIPPERRDRIFSRFYQAHLDGHLGGMGLGLYISRQIVELHGGQIRAEFPPDGGTRVVVLLPAD